MIKGFKNVNVYVEGQGIIKKTVLVKNGKITKICDKSNEEGLIELSNEKILIPGFIDEHVHGAAGSDAMYPNLEDSRNISKAIAQEGVSSYNITTMTQSVENIDKALKNAKEFIENNEYVGAKAIGIHLEGPFISKTFKGAQIESCIRRCSLDEFKHFEKVSGYNINQITLAYEEDGAELVDYLKEKGIVASLGHTNATYKQALEGIKRGVTCITHMYNAMSKLHHREPGVVGTALLSDDVRCELICDLIHVSPGAIRLLHKSKAKDAIILITDAMEAKHLEDGVYKLGGQEVYVKNGSARLIDGTLAGSILKMNEGVRNFQEVLNIPMTEAIDCASKNPALNLGIFDKKGSIKEGKDADFAVIDKDYNVYMTVSEGHVIFEK